MAPFRLVTEEQKAFAMSSKVIKQYNLSEEAEIEDAYPLSYL